MGPFSRPKLRLLYGDTGDPLKELMLLIPGDMGGLL